MKWESQNKRSDHENRYLSHQSTPSSCLSACPRELRPVPHPVSEVVAFPKKCQLLGSRQPKSPGSASPEVKMSKKNPISDSLSHPSRPPVGAAKPTPYADPMSARRPRLGRASPRAQMSLIQTVSLGFLLINLTAGCGRPGAEDPCKELSQARMQKTCEAHDSSHDLCKGSPVYALRLQELMEECRSDQSPARDR